MTTAYIYDVDSKDVVAKLSSNDESKCEQYFIDNFDTDTHAMTYSPAFGFDSGLNYVEDCAEIDV